jgi:CBS domain-containing protein
MDERNIVVRGWMSPPEFTVRPDALVEDAYAIMRREDIRHLLVLDDRGELVGVVTDRDLRRPNWNGEDLLSVRDMYLLGDELRVFDVMSEDPITVTPDELTSTAARIMVENKFNCLPVVNDRGTVVGILTSSDLLGALVYEVDPIALEAREAS